LIATKDNGRQVVLLAADYFLNWERYSLHHFFRLAHSFPIDSVIYPEKKGEALGLGVSDNMGGGENQFMTFPSARRATADSIAHSFFAMIHVRPNINDAE
jgi:hypothetical protein